MKMLDWKMKKLLRNKLDFVHGKENLREEKKFLETIQKSKTAFYESEAEGFLSKAEFLYQQSHYIHKRWWVVQGVSLLLLWWGLMYVGSNYYIRRCMGVVASLFVVMVMPELWKNKNANAMEVECTAFYSLRQIYAVRILLFALVDIALLSLFSLAAIFIANLLVEEIIIQFFLPFNVSCCICFCTLYSKWAYSEVFAVSLCLVWIAIWIEIVLNEKVYDAISVPVWIALFFISLLYLEYCIQRGQKMLLPSKE